MNNATTNKSAASKVESANKSNNLPNSVQKTTNRVIETHDISAAKHTKKELSSSDSSITTIRNKGTSCG